MYDVSQRTGAHIEKDHHVKQLISFMVFVTMEVFCINPAGMWWHIQLSCEWVVSGCGLSALYFV